MCWHIYDTLGNEPCFIYLIECDGFYKIGMTKDHPEKRLAGLQVGSPHEMTLVDYFESVPMIERMLHSKFAYARVRGEWFCGSPFIEQAFDRMGAQNCEACVA